MPYSSKLCLFPQIRVPPLRERRSDILLLADHFVQRHPDSQDIHLSPAAVDALMTYDWPGNVRELQRVIERAVTLSATGRIAREDLPPRVTGEYAERLLPSLVRDDPMRAWGGRYARLVLDRCENNKRQACRVLGISYHTLQAYLRYPSPAPGARRESPRTTTGSRGWVEGYPVIHGILNDDGGAQMGSVASVLRVLSDFGEAAGWLIAAFVVFAQGRRILRENEAAHAAIIEDVQENRKRIDENRRRIDDVGGTVHAIARDVAVLRDRVAIASGSP